MHDPVPDRHADTKTVAPRSGRGPWHGRTPASFHHPPKTTQKANPITATRNELVNLSIIRKYLGLYDTGKSQPDPQGLASLFDCIRPRTDDRDRYTVTGSAIRDKSSLDAFIDRVPKTQMQHVPQPAPNDDPILQRPDVDFEKHMLLAVVSHDPNRFVEVDIARVELMSGTLRVLCDFHPQPVEQKIISYGSYCAVIVNRFDGDVVLARD